MASVLGDQQPPVKAAVNDGTSGTTAATSSVVDLSVGGTNYATTVSTLTAAPNSYLAALFGGQWTPSLFVPGTNIPFIDRDPSSFKYVLAYLRSLRHGDSHLGLPESKQELKQLRAEAEFYGLPGLAQACTMGRLGSDLLRSQQQREQSQQRQQPSAMHREPTFATLRQSTSSGSNSGQPWNGAAVSDSTSQQTSTESTFAIDSNSCDPSNTRDSIAGEDVQLNMLQQQPATAQLLPQCMLKAHDLLVAQKQTCMQQPQLQLLADLILQHIMHLPLAAQQLDLVAALAQPEPGTQLLFQLQYYPIGDLRIELECKIVPASCTAPHGYVATLTTSAAAAYDSASPNLSPRDGSSSRPASAACAVLARTPSGSLLPNAAATLSRSNSPLQSDDGCHVTTAAPSAAVAAGSGVMPGPGWGGPVTYHKYSIRETADKFILTTKMPGEAQAVSEAARSTYRPELHKYSSLHKLLVQQCPRNSVAGLIWLLEDAGFASVKLSTVLETYFVGSNSFPGYKSVLLFEL